MPISDVLAMRGCFQSLHAFIEAYTRSVGKLIFGNCGADAHALSMQANSVAPLLSE